MNRTHWRDETHLLGRVWVVFAGRWQVAASVAVIGAAVLIFAGPRGPDTPPAGSRSYQEMSMLGVRTSVYEAGRLQLRVSADSVKLIHPRAFGPFRFGFLRSLTATNVTVETFTDEGTGNEERVARGVRHAWSVLAPKQLRKNVVRADFGPVRVVQSGRDGSVRMLEASRCSIAGTAEFACRKGSLRTGTDTVEFRKLSYDGRRLQILSRNNK